MRQCQVSEAYASVMGSGSADESLRLAIRDYSVRAHKIGSCVQPKTAKCTGMLSLHHLVALATPLDGADSGGFGYWTLMA